MSRFVFLLLLLFVCALVSIISLSLSAGGLYIWSNKYEFKNMKQPNGTKFTSIDPPYLTGGTTGTSEDVGCAYLTIENAYKVCDNQEDCIGFYDTGARSIIETTLMQTENDTCTSNYELAKNDLNNFFNSNIEICTNQSNNQSSSCTPVQSGGEYCEVVQHGKCTSRMGQYKDQCESINTLDITTSENDRQNACDAVNLPSDSKCDYINVHTDCALSPASADGTTVGECKKSEYTPARGTCIETATISVPADKSACDLVLGTTLSDSTACDTIQLDGTTNGTSPACTYTYPSTGTCIYVPSTINICNKINDMIPYQPDIQGICTGDDIVSINFGEEFICPFEWKYNPDHTDQTFTDCNQERKWNNDEGDIIKNGICQYTQKNVNDCVFNINGNNICISKTESIDPNSKNILTQEEYLESIKHPKSYNQNNICPLQNDQPQKCSNNCSHVEPVIKYISTNLIDLVQFTSNEATPAAAFAYGFRSQVISLKEIINKKSTTAKLTYLWDLHIKNNIILYVKDITGQNIQEGTYITDIHTDNNNPRITISKVLTNTVSNDSIISIMTDPKSKGINTYFENKLNENKQIIHTFISDYINPSGICDGYLYTDLSDNVCESMVENMGEGQIEWDNKGSARPYWLGIHWNPSNTVGGYSSDVVEKVLVPLTKDGNLPTEWQWTGIREAGADKGLHGMTPEQVVVLLNSVFPNAINLSAWHAATHQTAAMMPLPGSTKGGIFHAEQPLINKISPYQVGDPDDSGVMQIKLLWGGTGVPASWPELFTQLNNNNFRLMTQKEIRAYLHGRGPAGYAHTDALSITDALGIDVNDIASNYDTRTVLSPPKDILYPASAYGWGFPRGSMPIMSQIAALSTSKTECKNACDNTDSCNGYSYSIEGNTDCILYNTVSTIIDTRVTSTTSKHRCHAKNTVNPICNKINHNQEGGNKYNCEKIDCTFTPSDYDDFIRIVPNAKVGAECKVDTDCSSTNYKCSPKPELLQILNRPDTNLPPGFNKFSNDWFILDSDNTNSIKVDDYIKISDNTNSQCDAIYKGEGEVNRPIQVKSITEFNNKKYIKINKYDIKNVIKPINNKCGVITIMKDVEVDTIDPSSEEKGICSAVRNNENTCGNGDPFLVKFKYKEGSELYQRWEIITDAKDELNDLSNCDINLHNEVLYTNESCISENDECYNNKRELDCTNSSPNCSWDRDNEQCKDTVNTCDNPIVNGSSGREDFYDNYIIPCVENVNTDICGNYQYAEASCYYGPSCPGGVKEKSGNKIDPTLCDGAPVYINDIKNKVLFRSDSGTDADADADADTDAGAAPTPPPPPDSCSDFSGTYDDQSHWTGGTMTQNGCNVLWSVSSGWNASCSGTVSGSTLTWSGSCGSSSATRAIGSLSGNILEWTDGNFWQRRPGTDAGFRSGTISPCVNDDSTAGQDGHSTCTSWYDKHPETCGKHDVVGFDAAAQCCACGGGFLLPVPATDAGTGTGIERENINRNTYWSVADIASGVLNTCTNLPLKTSNHFLNSDDNFIIEKGVKLLKSHDLLEFDVTDVSNKLLSASQKRNELKPLGKSGDFICNLGPTMENDKRSTGTNLDIKNKEWCSERCDSSSETGGQEDVILNDTTKCKLNPGYPNGHCTKILPDDSLWSNFSCALQRNSCYYKSDGISKAEKSDCNNDYLSQWCEWDESTEICDSIPGLIGRKSGKVQNAIINSNFEWNQNMRIDYYFEKDLSPPVAARQIHPGSAGWSARRFSGEGVSGRVMGPVRPLKDSDGDQIENRVKKYMLNGGPPDAPNYHLREYDAAIEKVPISKRYWDISDSSVTDWNIASTHNWKIPYKCANDDSSYSKDGQDTCSSWFDNNPESCGSAEDPGVSDVPGRFNSFEQCCVCGNPEAGRKPSEYYDDNIIPGMVITDPDSPYTRHYADDTISHSLNPNKKYWREASSNICTLSPYLLDQDNDDICRSQENQSCSTELIGPGESENDIHIGKPKCIFAKWPPRPEKAPNANKINVNLNKKECNEIHLTSKQNKLFKETKQVCKFDIETNDWETNECEMPEISQFCFYKDIENNSNNNNPNTGIYLKNKKTILDFLKNNFDYEP